MNRISPLEYADAMRARGSRFCQGCKKNNAKKRDVAALCPRCIEQLPETIQNALKDRRLYPAAYTAALKILTAKHESS